MAEYLAVGAVAGPARTGLYRIPIPFDVAAGPSATAGSNLVAMVIDPSEAYGYAADLTAGSVVKIDLATLAVVGSVTLPSPPQSSPRGFAVIDASGANLYVLDGRGHMNRIDLATFTLAATGTTGVTVVVGSWTETLLLNGAGTYLYFQTQYDVFQISTTTLNPTGSLSSASALSGMAISPDGGSLYVGYYGAANFMVIATATMTQASTLIVASSDPVVALVDPTNTYLWFVGSSAGGGHFLNRVTLASGGLVYNDNCPPSGATYVHDLVLSGSGTRIYALYCNPASTDDAEVVAYDTTTLEAVGATSFPISAYNLCRGGSGNLYGVAGTTVGKQIASALQSFAPIAGANVGSASPGGIESSGAQMVVSTPTGVALISPPDWSVISSVVVAAGAAIDAVVADAGYNYAYAADYNTPGIWKVNLASMTVVGSVLAVGPSPETLAIDPAGAYLYVGDWYNGTITKIDLATFTVVGSPLAAGAAIASVMIDPAGAYLYAVNYSTTASVIKIDLSTFTVVGTINLAVAPIVGILDSAGTYLYVGQLGPPSTLAQINIATFAVAQSLTVPGGVLYIAADAAGANLYVAEDNGSVRRISIGSWAVVGSAPYSLVPWLGNVMSLKVTETEQIVMLL